jgi:hypothetical protein
MFLAAILGIGVSTPAAASASLVTGPTITLAGDAITSVNATWSSGTSAVWQVFACSQEISAGQLTGDNATYNATIGAFCVWLTSEPAGLTRPTTMAGVFVFRSPNNELYSTSSYSSSHRHLLTYTQQVTTRAWSATRLLGSASPVPSESSEEVAPPVYFGGPKITGFNKPASIRSSLGGDIRLDGRRMAKVTSATIGGVAAEFLSSRTSLRVTVPTGLHPGVYDLVLQTTSGRLTILRFVSVSSVS